MSKETKEKMLDAAMRLFHTQGYHGTSVRHIAEKANVNVALVSYYFGGKKGLFEQLMTQFLEGYMSVMSDVKKQEGCSRDKLLDTLRALLSYQQSFHHLARMVHREMALDSVLVREIMSTYLRKEKHDFEQLLREGVRAGEFRRQQLDYVLFQIKSMLTMPYLYPQYLRELYQLMPTEPYFVKKYMEHLTKWVDLFLCGKDMSSTKARLFVPVS
ncbi:forespore capture DNA-binding protein RefZ [Halalkalibacter urbisdiaboli]|uniref:forespore capture DNA-binding protein RefZ n=1 Tax=Halalkalibacter urbisdiaboli TaxID=1960589 RepID=UPI000B430E1E|nr:forespore capture DNA-binding protein RefZ [Halalkalibacter urbisdiaboli]